MPSFGPLPTETVTQHNKLPSMPSTPKSKNTTPAPTASTNKSSPQRKEKKHGKIGKSNCMPLHQENPPMSSAKHGEKQ